MSNRNHLFLALSSGGIGETVLGLRVAQSLSALGDRSVFFAGEVAAPLFNGGQFRFEEVNKGMGPLLELVIDDYIQREQPSTIILSDFFTAHGVMTDMDIDPTFVTRYGIPVIAIDTWSYRETGSLIDMFIGKRKEVAPWIESVSCITPVPIARTSLGSGACSMLPEPVRLATKVRRHLRTDLGIGDEDRAILLCTAKWQQGTYDDKNGQRIADQMPRLLAHYLDQLGQRVHLVHVGPSAIPSFSDGFASRYHWLPPLNSERFNLVLGACDLVLSPNVSATTVSKSIVSSIPTLVFGSSCAADDLDTALAWLPERPSSFLLQWLADSVPLYPFVLWPLGFHEFLTPLLDNNPYCGTFQTVEFLHEQRFVEAANALLFDSNTRHALTQRQLEYVESVKKLPDAGQIISSMLGG